MRRTDTRVSICLALVCVAAACGGNKSGGDSGAGGTPGTGGKTGTGGSGSGGTSSATGGSVGGSTSSAGGSGSGGSSSSAGGSSGAAGSGAGGTAPTGGAGGSSSEPLSCQGGGPGLTDCGSGESCCTSIKVPGGTFYRTYKSDSSGAATDTADPATLSDFRLDKYMVTVGRFRKFVAAWDTGDGYTPPAGSGKHSHLNGGKGLTDAAVTGGYESGWLDEYTNSLDMMSDRLECESDLYTWTRDPASNEKLPMNCINWFEAYAFCIWDGGFLPSEAEYTYAAAGGSEQRKYPWGAQDPAKANQYAIYGCYYPDGSGTCDGGGRGTIKNIAPVGTAKLGAGKWGHLDLVGDLQESLLDYFGTLANPCKDCANLAKASGRAPRDGYFGEANANLLLSSYHNNGFYPDNRFSSFGFRCARTP
jgi:sulfatase modifying factor 1